MRLLLGLALLLITACTPPPPVQDGPQMSVTSRFDTTRFAGEWHIVETLRETEFTTMRYDLKEDGSLAWFVGPGLIYDPHGEGWVNNQQFNVVSAGILQPVRTSTKNSDNQLVHWVDEDFQTAVVGSTSRTDAWILNRTPTLRADRLQAAKDILKFNGYDLSQLKTVPQ